jgi:hypothetical protein
MIHESVRKQMARFAHLQVNWTPRMYAPPRITGPYTFSRIGISELAPRLRKNIPERANGRIFRCPGEAGNPFPIFRFPHLCGMFVWGVISLETNQ